MKNCMLIIGLMVVTLTLQSQEVMRSRSNVERFLNTPGRSVVGFAMQSQKFSDIALMKYIDVASNDTMCGVKFSGTVPIGIDAGLNYYAYIDCEEVTKIISWLEYVKQEIVNKSAVDYFSFTPKRGTLLLSFTKIEKGFSFGIIYDKSNAGTASVILYVPFQNSSYDFNKLDEYLNKLIAIQRIIENNVRIDADKNNRKDFEKGNRQDVERNNRNGNNKMRPKP